MTKAKGDKIFSAETWKNVNKENKMILEDYVLEMKSKRKSEGTIYQYTADIKMFLCWLHDNEITKSLLNLKKRDFRHFFLEMGERGTSSARINRVQCSIRNLIEFCTSDDDEYEDYEINAMRVSKV
jgi:site-specific recombinase XerD